MVLVLCEQQKGAYGSKWLVESTEYKAVEWCTHEVREGGVNLGKGIK